MSCKVASERTRVNDTTANHPTRSSFHAARHHIDNEHLANRKKQRVSIDPRPKAVKLTGHDVKVLVNNYSVLLTCRNVYNSNAPRYASYAAKSIGGFSG
jgi:hypothetical protein